MNKSIQVKCPLCPGERRVTLDYLQHRGIKERHNIIKPCKTHAGVATRCRKFFDKMVYEGYEADERELLLRTYSEEGTNQKVAKKLGISLRCLTYLLKRHQIKRR